MCNQFTGSNAEIWVKPEQTNGVLAVDAVGTPLSTTLQAAANPGDTTIEVVGITNASTGDIIAVGGNDSIEYVKIHDSTAPAGNTITLDDNTKINFRHESGEAVLETDPTADWFKLGNVTNFTPNSNRALDESAAAAGGIRALSNLRLGSYDFGADITIEFDVESSPLWFYYALNNDYASVGTATAGASTTTDANAAIGDTIVSVTSETGFAVGEFAQLGTGTTAEVFKIGGVSAGQLDLDADAHPQGLRKAHTSGATCDEVIAPFTHTITKGDCLPVGLSILLRFTQGDGTESIALMTGNVVNTYTPTVSGDTTIPTFTINTVAKKMQILSENIFGTPTTVAHKPYAQYEAVVSVDGSAQTQNKITTLATTIENNVTVGRPVGTALPGNVVPGQGRITGTFDYEYDTQAFGELTQAGSEHQLTIAWTYQLDANHSLTMDLPTVIFGGNAHPAFSDLSRVSDSKTFSAKLDTVSTPNTDITITAVNNNPTVEYLVEAA